MTAILEVKDLVKDYPGVRAVAGVSFQVHTGTCFGLLGPNGAGKTTTVEIMEGITPATSGAVLYRSKAIDSAFKEEAGIQFQSTALQQFITVKETLEMFRDLYDRQADLDQVIDDCSLRDLLDRDNRKLSGGQLQRLLLGVALINSPRLVFLDEPTTGLDPQARRNFWDLISRIRSGGATIILTTHYMEEAEFLCDEIAIMDVGKIIKQGYPDALLEAQYKHVIIELPLSDFDGDLAGIEHRVLETQGVIEIETDDVNASLQALAARASGLNGMKIRQPNLEDLFLDLTGHSLRA